MEKVANELRDLISAFGQKLRQLDDAEISVRPRPDKWARKEVLGHLIDSASNNQQKFVRMMAQPHLDFVGYKQDQWVDHQNYAAADWQGMIRLWESYNEHIAYLIETIKCPSTSLRAHLSGRGRTEISASSNWRSFGPNAEIRSRSSLATFSILDAYLVFFELM